VKHYKLSSLVLKRQGLVIQTPKNKRLSQRTNHWLFEVTSSLKKKVNEPKAQTAKIRFTFLISALSIPGIEYLHLKAQRRSMSIQLSTWRCE
jgi:hypothetical protein